MMVSGTEITNQKNSRSNSVQKTALEEWTRLKAMSSRKNTAKDKPGKNNAVPVVTSLFWTPPNAVRGQKLGIKVSERDCTRPKGTAWVFAAFRRRYVFVSLLFVVRTLVGKCGDVASHEGCTQPEEDQTRKETSSVERRPEPQDGEGERGCYDETQLRTSSDGNTEECVQFRWTEYVTMKLEEVLERGRETISDERDIGFTTSQLQRRAERQWGRAARGNREGKSSRVLAWDGWTVLFFWWGGEGVGERTSFHPVSSATSSASSRAL